jgi:hypothetical protein
LQLCVPYFYELYEAAAILDLFYLVTEQQSRLQNQQSGPFFLALQNNVTIIEAAEAVAKVQRRRPCSCSTIIVRPSAASFARDITKSPPPNVDTIST